MHKDIVTAVPEGAENLGATERCEIQGLYAPGRYISVQGHPEFTEDIVREILLARGHAGIFTGDELEDYLSRVGLEHDGVVVAKAFLKFIKEGTEQ
jgi:GMP synthase-like glutamine amidotransferase